MIMTNFAQRLKLVNFFQTTKFSNINIIFRNISLMFVQSSEVISAKRFSYGLCLNGSVHKYAYVSKTQKTDQSNQNQKRK
jgi:hypothetical protein